MILWINRGFSAGTNFSHKNISTFYFASLKFLKFFLRNESTVLLFTGNFFSEDMVKFYWILQDSGDRVLWHYPEKPVDVYSPTLNVTWLIERCEATNVKYLLLYEHNAEKYFDSEWKPYYVVDRLVFSGRFMFEAVLGTYPRRVIIIRFLSNS